MSDSLRRIRCTADYQFGKGVGDTLFPTNVKVVYSQKTGRIRYIYLDKERLATLRPTDGKLSLSLAGAKRIIESSKSARCIVTVRSDVSKFIAEGGDAFAAHVVKVDGEVHAKDEVIVVNEDGGVLAVGRAFLSAEEMKSFRRGVAVKVRHGNAEEG